MPRADGDRSSPLLGRGMKVVRVVVVARRRHGSRELLLVRARIEQDTPTGPSDVKEKAAVPVRGRKGGANGLIHRLRKARPEIEHRRLTERVTHRSTDVGELGGRHRALQAHRRVCGRGVRNEAELAERSPRGRIFGRAEAQQSNESSSDRIMSDEHVSRTDIVEVCRCRAPIHSSYSVLGTWHDATLRWPTSWWCKGVTPVDDGVELDRRRRSSARRGSARLDPRRRPRALARSTNRLRAWWPNRGRESTSTRPSRDQHLSRHSARCDPVSACMRRSRHRRGLAHDDARRRVILPDEMQCRSKIDEPSSDAVKRIVDDPQPRPFLHRELHAMDVRSTRSRYRKEAKLNDDTLWSDVTSQGPASAEDEPPPRPVLGCTYARALSRIALADGRSCDESFTVNAPLSESTRIFTHPVGKR